MHGKIFGRWISCPGNFAAHISGAVVQAKRKSINLATAFWRTGSTLYITGTTGNVRSRYATSERVTVQEIDCGIDRFIDEHGYCIPARRSNPALPKARHYAASRRILPPLCRMCQFSINANRMMVDGAGHPLLCKFDKKRSVKVTFRTTPSFLIGFSFIAVSEHLRCNEPVCIASW